MIAVQSGTGGPQLVELSCSALDQGSSANDGIGDSDVCMEVEDADVESSDVQFEDVGNVSDFELVDVGRVRSRHNTRDAATLAKATALNAVKQCA